MDDLLIDFIAETRDTLEGIAGEIVAWEADPADRTRLDSIFRFVHTVKGSCGFLDLPRLLRLSHAAEDALAEVRSGARVPDAALVSAVLAVIDRIGELNEALETKEDLPEAIEGALIAALAPHADIAAAPNAPKPSLEAAHGLPARTVARSIRLPVGLLDRMMASVSDMVLARNELGRCLRSDLAGQEGDAAFDRLSQCVGEMRDAITRTRMARIDNLFAALPRLVRDLASELGKMVTLDVDGGDVELDREMIEMIRDPLTHIVRNSIDHGIEFPPQRLAVGKPETGRLRVGARQSGNQILIEISDDGRGIDAGKVVERAIAAGLVTPEQAAAMSREAELDLIFSPGLSTAAKVTSISGRGVGMDVVRANVERIGGKIDVESRTGEGLRIVMRVPLTLTIIPALTISSAGVHFAIPRSAIDEIVRSDNAAVTIERIGGGLVACIRGTRLPIVDLAAFMGLADSDAAPPLLAILHAGGGAHYALGVTAVHDHEELVVKPAAPALMASGVYAGTTLPDNSRPMLLLDVAGIATLAGIEEQPAVIETAVADATADLLPTLLFVDLDGAHRAIRLSLVQRIEDVATAGVVESGGSRLLAHDGRLISFHAAGPLPSHERMRVLHVGGDAASLAYAIDRVIDVEDLPIDYAPAAADGPIAGVLLRDGLPIELLDPFWLFAQAHGEVAAGSLNDADGAPPLCLLADADDAWARAVMAPLLRAAGYRVSHGAPASGERVAVVIASGAAPAGVDAPLVRLRSTREEPAPADGSVYRYDRAGLLSALDRHARARKHA
ncbi:chemotaxis protein CheA [Sphingomonas nostoxanthinifaciens]|uniref:chemotaxis protein CheA n=1 Tax=Sphingomonas nostoxanthinifaciens TaxID=2872652 RepID=UPI001CC1D0FB|nr:chemotaxis protein CheW [Sphingomonas nostoxanthinifaciens]UAK26317.1 chemotaxis protein CheW [Sphingomonas nostoxanthinifaciens]